MNTKRIAVVAAAVCIAPFGALADTEFVMREGRVVRIETPSNPRDASGGGRYRGTPIPPGDRGVVSKIATETGKVAVGLGSAVGAGVGVFLKPSRTAPKELDEKRPSREELASARKEQQGRKEVEMARKELKGHLEARAAEAEMARIEKVAAEKVAAEKVAVEKAAAEKAAAEKAAAARATPQRDPDRHHREPSERPPREIRGGWDRTDRHAGTV